MTTSHSTHRSITGIANSARRLVTRHSSKADNHPAGSDFGQDRDFARVANDLDALSRVDWRR
jgi:hypothetical protein